MNVLNAYVGGNLWGESKEEKMTCSLEFKSSKKATGQSTQYGSPAANGPHFQMMTASVNGFERTTVKKWRKRVLRPGTDAMILVPRVPLPKEAADCPDTALSARHYRGDGCAGSSAHVSTRRRWRGAIRLWWTGDGCRRGHRERLDEVM